MKNIKNHWEDVYTDVRVQSVEDYIAMKIMEKNQVTDSDNIWTHYYWIQ